MKLRSAIHLSTIALTLCIAFADYAAGRELNLWFLYLAPISLGTIMLGRRTGIGLSVLASACLFANGYLLGNPFSSNGVYLIDRLSNVLTFVLVTFLVAIAREALSVGRQAEVTSVDTVSH